MPEEENNVPPESLPENGAEPISEDEKTPAEVPAKPEQTIPKSRFDEVYAELKALKEKPQNQPQPSAINTVELIKASKTLDKFSNEEIDAISRFTGKKNPTPEDILKASDDPFVKAGIAGIREKVEKERALDPSTRQPETPKEKTFEDAIEETKGSNPFKVSPEREKLMEEQGLWKSPRPRTDRIPLSNG